MRVILTFRPALPALVPAAEALALILVATFTVLIASDGLRGRIFELRVSDPVGRTPIRNAQIALVLGYGGFFAFSITGMLTS